MLSAPVPPAQTGWAAWVWMVSQIKTSLQYLWHGDPLSGEGARLDELPWISVCVCGVGGLYSRCGSQQLPPQEALNVLKAIHDVLRDFLWE